MNPGASFYLDRPLVFAHRGARDIAPENTLAAFQAALDVGADGIELDVCRCASGEIVVIHDDSVDRTTNSSGSVATIKLAALKALDAGAWFDARFAGETIPTLREVFEFVNGRMLMNIEIKGRALRGDSIESEIAELVRHFGMDDRVILSSFNPAALVRARQAAPHLPRGMLFARPYPAALSIAWMRPWVRPQALHPHFSEVTPAWLARARRRGYRVNPWTINEEADLWRLAQMGVDSLITDHPALALRIVRELRG